MSRSLWKPYHVTVNSRKKLLNFILNIRIIKVFNKFNYYLRDLYNYKLSNKTYKLLRLKNLFFCKFIGGYDKITPLKRDTILRIYSKTQCWLLVGRTSFKGGTYLSRRIHKHNAVTLQTQQELCGLKFGMFCITRDYGAFRSKVDKKKLKRLQKLLRFVKKKKK